MSTRIVVAMSGGVDSSVAAALLHEQGYEVIGVTMQLWGKDVCASSATRLCCSVRDAMDAKAVAKRLGIRHEVLELEQAFRTNVIDYFVESYHAGLTPNPCIACNDHIKFGALLTHADTRECSLIATGHYARSSSDVEHGRYLLKRATTPEKDQSYVLFNLTQAQLSRARFPIGELSKSRVREIARSLGLATADKPDSQDVCFVRDRNKDRFLRRELGAADAPGPITDVEGRVLGAHHGLLGYTIGQREGLGIAIGKPLYVVAMDQPRNRLIVGSREDLLSRTLTAERVNWVSVEAPDEPLRAWAKIRSRHEPALATITPMVAGGAERGPHRPAADDADSAARRGPVGCSATGPATRVDVEFDEPQSAITPGQAVVFYDGELVLGGGWIAKNSE